MVDTTYKVIVNSDNIEGKTADKARINRCVESLKQAGYNAVASGVGPNYHVSDMKNNKNSYIVSIVGGLCAGTIADYSSPYYQAYMKQNNNRGGQAYYAKHGKYKVPASQLTWLERAHDDNFSRGGFKGCNPQEELKKAGFDDAFALDDETFPEAVTEMVKNGGTAVTVGGNKGNNTKKSTKPVRGFVNAAKGSSPQFWNREEYTDYEEIPFHKITITNEDPEIKAATLQTTEELPLLEGRDAVLITGEDCNDFSGIVIKKEYNVSQGLWEYTIHGWLDRIMANEITYIADGTETVHKIITNILEDTGLPTENLLPVDDYTVKISDKTKDLMEKDEDTPETSELYLQQLQENTNSESSEDEETKKKKQELVKTLATDKNRTEINPMKKKPVGIFKKKTIGDLIRALIHDYGSNIHFYGDINGIPHFDILDLETWTRTGFIIPEEYGFGEEYQYQLDITNIVTQVGIENISAINGNGEIYTSDQLLGINLENYVGRMGVVLENPSAQGQTGTEDTKETEKKAASEIKTRYQDKTGKTHTTTPIETKGYPSCTMCIYTNGGAKPVYKRYHKYWLNKCPGCGKENKMTHNAAGDGKIVCGKCKKEYCEFCGYSKNGGRYQLTELYQVQVKQENSKETGKNTSTGREV